MTRPVRIVTLWIISLVYFALVPVVILYSLGYRFKPHTWALERTGLIYVRPDRSGAGLNAYIDGSAQEKAKSPIRFAFLRPGDHRVVLSHPDVLSWSATVPVVSGEAVRLDPVRLVATPSPLVGTEWQETCETSTAVLYHHRDHAEQWLMAFGTTTLTTSSTLPLSCVQDLIIREESTTSFTIFSSNDGIIPALDQQRFALTAPLKDWKTVHRLGAKSLVTQSVTGGTLTRWDATEALAVTTPTPTTTDAAPSTSLTAPQGTPLPLITSDTPRLLTANDHWTIHNDRLIVWNAVAIDFFDQDGRFLDQDRFPWIPDDATAATLTTRAQTEIAATLVARNGIVLVYGPTGGVAYRGTRLIWSTTEAIDRADITTQTFAPDMVWWLHGGALSTWMDGREQPSDIIIPRDEHLLGVDAAVESIITVRGSDLLFRSLLDPIRGQETSRWTAPTAVDGTVMTPATIDAEHHLVKIIEASTQAPHWFRYRD